MNKTINVINNNKTNMFNITTKRKEKVKCLFSYFRIESPSIMKLLYTYTIEGFK
jgi:hypothetical protein